MFKTINDKYGINFSELLSLGSILAFSYLIFFKLIFFNILNVEWYIALLSPQQVIFSSLTLLIIGIVSASISLYFDKLFNLKLTSELEDLAKLFVYIVIIFFIIRAIEVSNYIKMEIPIKYKDYINYIGLNIGSISLYLFHKKVIIWTKKKYKKTHPIMDFIKKWIEKGIKIIAPIMIIIGLIITPMVLGYDYAHQIKTNMSKILPEVTLKNEQQKWYLLEANSTDALLIKKINNEEEEYTTRTIEMKEIEGIKK